MGVNRLGGRPAGRLRELSGCGPCFLRPTLAHVGWAGSWLGEMTPNVLQIFANRHKTAIGTVQQPCGEQVRQTGNFQGAVKTQPEALWGWSPGKG